MEKELYDRIDTAAKFVGEQAPVTVTHEEQAAMGLGWASRQQERPQPEAVVVMKPIVAIA